MNQSIKWTRTRPPVAGRHGAVACAHPLASLAGLDMLRGGGNAIDAVVAMAATLGVVEPYMSGPGGVGFLLFHPADGEPRTLNFGGNTPAAATPEKYTPEQTDVGPRACLIPGNVAGWFEALNRHGTKSPADVFTPAATLAEEGFPLHPFNVKLIGHASPRLNVAGRKVFGDLPLRVGAILRQPDLAGTYRKLIEQGPDVFYRGQLAERIVDYLQSQGGLLDKSDLENYASEWEAPISVNYRGLEVRTCPPNNEGFQILQTLRLLEAFDLSSLGHNTADYIQVVTEAIKLAVADRIRFNSDPKFYPVPLDRLLSDDYIAERQKLIDRHRASRSEGERWRGGREAGVVAPGQVEGLTTHMAAVDEHGNVASITQSLGNGFGSGVMIPETGLMLNNFIWWADADPQSPPRNRLEPGKRWSACMAPLHVIQDGRFWFSIATPGSWGILQTTLQMMLNIVEFGADPQLAIEAPRFRTWEDTRLQIEDRVAADVRDELKERGHVLDLAGDFSHLVGGGHSVLVDPESGARVGGADPRRDGYALAY